MPKITQAIPSQAFEIIRNRIGLILAEEIDNQSILTYDPDLDLTVWVERTVPFDKTELPCVNVSLARGSYDSKTYRETDSTYTYNIDVFANSESSNGVDGDIDSKFILHKLLGVCRAILENQAYKTLGFLPAFVMRSAVVDLNIAETNPNDGNYSTMGRLTLSVRVPEVSQIPDAETIAGISTSIKLAQTNQGYYYQFGSSPTPPALPTVIIFATKTTVVTGETIELGWIATNVDNVSITNLGQKPKVGYQEVEIINTITFEITATNAAGTATDSITIFVGAACLDATAVLKDTANNTLSTTNIPSGATEPIIAPNGTIQLFNTVPTLIQTETVRSGQTKPATIADVVYTDSDASIKSVPYDTPLVCTPQQVLPVDFSVNDTTPDTNQTITFTDLTVGATSWLWDFGDGNLSTLQTPTHQYKTTGTFTVTLCAGNGTNAGREVKTNFITVSLEAEVTTNLIASYNAGNVVNDGSGNASEWTENVNSYNALQGTLINRPLIVPNDLNGFATLQFDGSNDQLLNSNVAFATTTSTVYMVFRRGRIHTANECMQSGANSVVANARVIYNPPNEVSYFPRNQTLVRGVSYGNNVNQWLIMAVVFDGANSSIKFMQSAPALVGNIGSTATFGIVIGAAAGGAWFQGKIAEKKVYDVAHNAATQAQVIQRLQAKFNLYD
jgi:PKD repeat protein